MPHDDTQPISERLADALTESANRSHARLLDAIRQGEIAADAARAALTQETQLRQYANGLYVDAAARIVEALEGTQQELVGVIDAANARIAEIQRIDALLDLIADLVALAAAASAGKPKPIVAALQALREDVIGLEAG